MLQELADPSCIVVDFDTFFDIGPSSILLQLGPSKPTSEVALLLEISDEREGHQVI